MDYEKKYVRHMPLCLECGNVIRYGRTDKKFCCEDCKSRHHNNMAKAGRSFKVKVLKLMDRNYEILDGLLRSGRNSADLLELMPRGFTPGMVTSFNKSGRHDIFTCYDIKYRMTPTRISHMEKIQKLSVPLHEF